MGNVIERKCLFCNRNDEQVPLIQLSYQASDYWICSQHIPVLIHKPDKLDGILSNIDRVEAV